MNIRYPLRGSLSNTYVTEIKKGFPPVCTCLAGISGLKPMLRSARLLLPLFCFGLQFHRFIIPCQLLTE